MDPTQGSLKRLKTRRGGDFVRIIKQGGCLAWGSRNSGEISTLNLVLIRDPQLENTGRGEEGHESLMKYVYFTIYIFGGQQSSPDPNNRNRTIK